jgi:hypothetical protein
LNEDSWFGSNTPETSKLPVSMVTIKVCCWVNGYMGIYRYKGGYITFTVSVVTIEFGCYIASIYIAYLLFRKLLNVVLPYSFDSVVRISIGEIFNRDDRLEGLDAIDIWCLIKPISLSELLNCDKTLIFCWPCILV